MQTQGLKLLILSISIAKDTRVKTRINIKNWDMLMQKEKETNNLKKSTGVFGLDGEFGSYQQLNLFVAASNPPNYGV